MKPYSANPNLTEPRWLSVLLTAVALGFLLLMLVVPLVAVFYEALKGGRILESDVLTETRKTEHRIFCRIQEFDLP